MPGNFMFRLSVDEWTSISSQFVMTSRTKRPKSALPFVFTEHGALMLASMPGVPGIILSQFRAELGINLPNY